MDPSNILRLILLLALAGLVTVIALRITGKVVGQASAALPG